MVIYQKQNMLTNFSDLIHVTFYFFFTDAKVVYFKIYLVVKYMSYNLFDFGIPSATIYLSEDVLYSNRGVPSILPYV